MAETEPGDVEVTITVTLTRKEVLLLSSMLEESPPLSLLAMSAFKNRSDMVECHDSMQGKVQRAILDVAAPPRPPFGTWHGHGGTGRA